MQTNVRAQGSASPKRVVILIIDGVSSGTLEQLMDNGRLPTMSALRRSGNFNNNVVATFPTVSGPAHVPLIMGVIPSQLDIIGHNQFIRQEGRLENYLLRYKLLDKRLAGRPSLYSQYHNSVSVAEPVRVGAAAYRKNLFGLADWAKIKGPANGYVMHLVEHEYRRGRDCIVAWLHETDGLAHRLARQLNVAESLARLDRWLNRFLAHIDKETTIVLTSDHGMEWTTQKPFSIPRALADAGLARDQYRYFLDGGAFCQIYLKSNGSYALRLDESTLGDVPSKLVQYQQIDLVLYRRAVEGGSEAVIVNARGRASVRKVGTCYYYRIEQGHDPLGYLDGPTGGSFMTGLEEEQCLMATADTRYPDGHYQAYELLNAPSSGDIIVTAAPAVSFNPLTRHAVHGGLQREQSVVFFLSNRDLSAGSACLRTRDLPRLLGVQL